jgi:hypothetical protein
VCMQITHLFIADSLWIALVLLIAEVSITARNPFLSGPPEKLSERLSPQAA